MQLAAAPIMITMDGEAFALRPSLRAAYILERRHTYAGILTAITDIHTSIIADLVELGSGTMQARSALAADIDRHGASILIKLRPALMAFLTALIGIEESNEQPASESTTKQTFAAFYERLFALGTGWLDWTPEQTWHATPAEIMAAYHGKLDYLKTIYGSTEDAKANDSKPDAYNAARLREIEEQGFDPAFDRQGLAALKANLRSAS